MTAYEFEHEANHLRHQAHTLVMLVNFGDLIGVPVMPPYYSLRLLPYVVGEIDLWKRQVLREHDPLENEEYDLIDL